MSTAASPDYLRGFSSGVEAAECAVGEALDRAAEAAQDPGRRIDVVEDELDRLRIELGLRHPYGAHHDPPGLASRLPE